MHMLHFRKAFVFLLAVLFLFCIVTAVIFYWKNIKSLASSTGKQGMNSLGDLIQVISPKANEKISSPLVISGQARGLWYFEAVFPIRLFDDKGNEISKTQGRALSEWATNEFVSFRAELKFTASVGTYGTLVLEKDNPSGLTQNVQELRIPVQFK